MDWFIWRLVTSTRMHVSLVDLEDRWSFDDAAQAHSVIDALEDAERILALRAKQASKR